MALRILTLLSIISLFCFGADYQIANRAGYYEVPTATMLTSTWTGTTSWAVGNIVSNELIDFSPARNNMPLVDANCVVLDGTDVLTVDDSAGKFNPGSNDLTVCGWVYKPATTLANKYLCGKYYSVGDRREWAIRFDATSRDLTFIASPDGTASMIGVSTVASASIPEGWIYFELLKSGTNCSWEINGSPISSVENSIPATIFSGSASTTIGGVTTPSYTGKTADLEILTGREHLRYTFSGGLGMGLDEPDVSGNGNDGTWSTDDAASLRSGKQDVFHYNFMEGCSVVSNKYTPADKGNLGYDTDGNLLTNPRGYAHNNSESSIVIGSTTNSYANLLTNSVNIVTNSAGLITEFFE